MTNKHDQLKTWSPLVLALLLPSLSPSLGQAAGALRCEDLFRSPPQVSRTYLPTEIPFHIRQKVDFQKLIPSGEFIQSVSTRATGSEIAVVSLVQGQSTGKNGNAKIRIIDTSSNQVLLNGEFDKIKAVSLLSEANLIAITASKPEDGKAAKLYLYEFESGANSSTAGRIASNPATSKGPTSGLPALRDSANGSFKSGMALAIPGSQYHGVLVDQIVLRRDLPYAFVVQDSANARATVRYEPTEPGVSPTTSLLNQGTTVIDAKTMANKGELKFGELVPIRASLNPKSTMMALHLVNPMVAKKRQHTVVVVDAREPQKALFTYAYEKSGFTIPVGPNAVVGVSNFIRTSWSPDGRYLAMMEQQTGSLTLHDTESGKNIESIRAPDERWPIAGSTYLADGRLVLVRIGQRPGSLELPLEKALFVSILEPGQSSFVRPENHFEIRLSGQAAAEGLFEPGAVKSMIELKNGKMLAIQLRQQLALINLEKPTEQTVLSPMSDSQDSRSAEISSMRKRTENKIEISDRQSGLFELEIP